MYIIYIICLYIYNYIIYILYNLYIIIYIYIYLCVPYSSHVVVTYRTMGHGSAPGPEDFEQPEPGSRRDGFSGCRSASKMVRFRETQSLVGDLGTVYRYMHTVCIYKYVFKYLFILHVHIHIWLVVTGTFFSMWE